MNSNDYIVENAQRFDYEAKVRDRQYDEKDKYLVEEMMGESYVTFFEDEDTEERKIMEAEFKRDAQKEDEMIARYEAEQERNLDHARDNSI